MSAESTSSKLSATGELPQGREAVKRNVSVRQAIGRIWQTVLLGCTLVGLVVLVLLLYNVVNDAFGGVAFQSAVPLAEITGSADRELSELSNEELIAVLEENLRSRVLRNLEREQALSERSTENLIEIVETEIFQPEIVGIFTLSEYLFNRDAITAQLAEDFPRAELEFRSWVSADFVTEPTSSRPEDAGVRNAIFGTLWMLGVTMLVAFPLGVGAAIYLEEYSNTKPFDERSPLGRRLNAILTRISGVIQVNIYNLSGVPSIIYGILGLAIFVRALEIITSGRFLGGVADATANGRTILSAGLTMALLVLPVVIISSQEAIRSVPQSIRQASFGLGATRWQTIWRVVLPNALPGILTGTILAVSRAVGETAPLIVIGASTFINTDPGNVFSKFTALPIQIYNWTARPQDEFRAIAAAAIIVLLIILLSLNAIAIITRNYLRSQRVSS